MTEIKLTEAEIMKVLECCSKKVAESCAECPLRGINCLDISIEQLAIDLITDKNDSIEMYRRNIALLDEQILAKDKEIEMFTDIGKLYSEIKAEAIKEVYTRLAMNFGTYTDNDSVKLVDLFRLFDQIAKEMGVEL